MSKKLEELVDKAYEGDKSKLEKCKPEGIDPDEFVTAVKEKCTQAIYIEIKQELEQEVTQEVERKLKKQQKLQQISELKKLTVSGLVLAFIVGLLVNQITEMISFLKGEMSAANIWVTVIIALVLAAASILITVYVFLSEGLKLLNGRE